MTGKLKDRNHFDDIVDRMENYSVPLKPPCEVAMSEEELKEKKQWALLTPLGLSRVAVPCTAGRFPAPKRLLSIETFSVGRTAYSFVAFAVSMDRFEVLARRRKIRSMCGPVVAPATRPKALQKERTYVRISGWKDRSHRKRIMGHIEAEMGSDFEKEQKIRHASLFCIPEKGGRGAEEG